MPEFGNTTFGLCVTPIGGRAATPFEVLAEALAIARGLRAPCPDDHENLDSFG